ncbi:MAG: hypothetical protein OEY86_12040 [Nitrospira sp.]|nr:hypothetical protein [Nitrospira sp.]
MTDLKPSSTALLLANPVTHIIIATLVLIVDIATGHEVRFPILFVIPVLTAAWYSHPTVAYGITLLLPIIRQGIFFGWHWPSQPEIIILNTTIIISVLLLVSYLAIKTARQTRELAKRVQQLEGLLPICMHCHQIRNGQQAWHQLEEYITSHSKAQFSHGICPDCRVKYYPQFFPKQDKRGDSGDSMNN